MCSRMASWASPTRSFDSTYYIPGVEAAESKNHIVLNQTKWASRGEWRVNDFGLEAIRFWFGATDYKHDEVDSVPVTVIGSTFLQTHVRGAHGGAASAGQDRAGRAARRRRRAVVGSRSAGGRGGRHPADSDEYAKPRRLRLRGIAADEEAAFSGRRAHRERRRHGHGLHVPAELPAAARRPDADPGAAQIHARRASAPASSTICPTGSSRASPGSTSSGRPMPPSCSTRDRTTRRPPSRSATPI